MAANTFTVFENVFVNPSQLSTVNLHFGGNGGDTPARLTKPVQLTPFYKRLTTGVLLVAVLCLLLQVGLGFAWPEPTAAQINVNSALDYGWKMGFGVVIGLLTGKSVP